MLVLVNSTAALLMKSIYLYVAWDQGGLESGSKFETLESVDRNVVCRRSLSGLLCRRGCCHYRRPTNTTTVWLIMHM